MKNINYLALISWIAITLVTILIWNCLLTGPSYQLVGYGVITAGFLYYAIKTAKDEDDSS